ncbi:MAG: GntR family transcriptional regulator, partial [Pseudomonadota bacterium]
MGREDGIIVGLDTGERRTTAADIFSFLHDEIIAMNLIPGARISEHEVARRLNVSRQPVREAFIRLADLKLIEIRPQRATIVRRFSVQEIRTARFVRQSVEFEVLRLAVARRNAGDISRMRQNLKQQAKAVDQKNVQQFHALDYQFHQLFCRAAGVA